MRFSFRKKPASRWIDSAALAWTPEEPFAFAADTAQLARAMTRPDAQPSEPKTEPQAKAPEDPIFFGPGFFSDEAFRAFVEPREQEAPPEALVAPALPAEAVNTN